MAPDAARLLALADAVAEGKAVDWAEAESTSVTHEDRELVRQLQLLAGVAGVHRTALQPAADERVGKNWGPLHIKERIGGGTFGAVYRAHDPRLARDVALKLLHYDASRDRASAAIEEGRLLARVRDPHVITVYGADRHEGTVGVWMELISGRTLEDVLRNDGPLGAREAAVVGIDLCSALAAVHAQGLVHRDVKAQNVMREDGGRIVLMDFGAGQETTRSTGTSSVGTPAYMAPEVLRGDAATVRSDLYSLGVLLFRLLTGKYPTTASTATGIGREHDAGSARRLRDLRPELSTDIVRVIERATAPNATERFESAGAMQRALEATLVGPPQGTEKRALTGRQVGAIAAFVILIVAAAGVLWPRLGGGTAPPSRTIAVRPLKNLNDDAAQRYFAAGLTDVLLAHLGALKALKVVALSDSAVSTSDLAKLGADGVLEASVQRDSGRIRVSAKLLHAGSGTLLWGRVYDGSETDAFSLQARIAEELARDLGVPVSAVESRRLGRKYAVNPQAQEAYLRGRYLLDHAGRPNLVKARAELETAVRLDASYAPAFASLARTYLALATVGELSPEEVRKLAPPAAAKAHSLDPTLAEAVLAVADVRFRLDWDWQGAESAYREAIDLNPSLMIARSQYARFLAAAGRIDDATREAQDAYAIDPLSADIHLVVGTMLYYARRYADAATHFQARDEERPSRYVGLGRSLSAVGRHQEAIAAMRHAVTLAEGSPNIQAELARTLAAAGESEAALQILGDLERRRSGNADYVAPQDLAYIYIALGRLDIALGLFSEALNEQASRLLWVGVDPRVDALRADPRFQAMVEKLRPHRNP